MEKSIPIDYLTNLSKAYDLFIKDISKVIPVIKVDWNEFKTPEVSYGLQISFVSSHRGGNGFQDQGGIRKDSNHPQR